MSCGFIGGVLDDVQSLAGDRGKRHKQSDCEKSESVHRESLLTVVGL
jgi:hypothetical protein